MEFVFLLGEMYTSNSEDSDSDSGTNFKRGKRKPKEESPKLRRQEITTKTENRNAVEKISKSHNEGRNRRLDAVSMRANDDRKAYRSIDDKDKHHTHISNRHSKDYRSKSRDRNEHKSRRSKSSERRKVYDSKLKRSRSTERNRELSPSHRRESHKRRPEVDATESSRHRESNPKHLSRVISPSEQSKINTRKRHSPQRKQELLPRGSHSSHDKDDKPSRSSSKNSTDSKKQTRPSSSEASCYGPALPPPTSSSMSSEANVSSLPRNLKRKSPSSPVYKPKIGPTLPKNFQPMKESDMDVITSDDDDGMIGPLLPGSSEMSERDLELEKRKIELKLKQLDRRMEAVSNSDVKFREEWMLELPEIRKIPDMGLGTRQFRKNDRPDFSDRDQWTKAPNDQPNSKKERQDTKKSDEDKRHELETKRRDEEQEKMAKEHKKSHKRNKSLMEIHEKKLKKEKVRLLNKVTSF